MARPADVIYSAIGCRNPHILARCDSDECPVFAGIKAAQVSMTARLATLVFIFAFQADNITSKSLHVILISDRGE